MRRSSSLHSVDDLVERKISNDKYQDIIAIGNDIDSIVTVANNIGAINTINTDIIPNIVEILQADDNALIVSQLYTLFDSRFLGSKSAEPIVDNNGDPLTEGVVYYNSVSGGLFVYTSTGWADVVGSSSTHTLTNKTINSITNYVGANHIHYPVRNESGATIPAGTIVHSSSTQPGTDYLVVIPVTDPQTQIAIGVTHTELANNSIGLVTNTGVVIDSVDTSLWDEGTLLYVGSSGFTPIKPTTGQYQACAVVTRKHALHGTLLVEFTEPKVYATDTIAGYVTLVDNTTTEDNTKALTANQGKLLSDRVITIENDYWNSTNDGIGSGLDADLLAGQSNSYYLDWVNFTNTPTTLAIYGITDAAPLSHVGSGGTAHAQVTTTVDGFMIATDKVKLNGIETGATADQTGSEINTLITGLDFSWTGQHTFKEIAETEYANTGTVIDPANGTIQTITLTTNTTYTDALVSGQSVLLEFAINSSSFVVTWPTITWISGIDGIAGTEIQPSTTMKTQIEIYKIGTTLYGALVGYA